jgi:hypothetical protein
MTKKNASGRKWSSGPNVRKKERKLWNALYARFYAELYRSGDYPRGTLLFAEQIDVLAYNLAYEAVWELRDG